jgi:tRNA(Ile)-lysidine synthase TilS/MesJ
MTKQELKEYARQRNLEWREDSTNQSDAYLRNRLRPKAAAIPEDDKRQLRALHARQRELRAEINEEIRNLIGEGPQYSRYLFTHLPAVVALEALRFVTNKKLTRPQLKRVLHAVKTNAAGSNYEAGVGITVHFTTRYFTL